MHRQAVIAVLAAAVLVPGLQAQRRAGARHGAFRGTPGRVVAPARGGFAPRPMAIPPGRSFGFRGGAGFGHRPPFFHHRRRFFFTSGCFNGFCNPWYPGYYYVAPPIFWSGFDYQPAYDTGMPSYPAAAPAYDDSALRAEIQRLTDEVEQLREEQEARSRAAQQAPEARPTRAELPTILVFRDGRRSEVQNYGIVGGTLWIFTEQHAKKIPLEQLDLTATRNVNEERGVSFVVPVDRGYR